ncbi:MAG: RluA family pseudouridine synthase [Prevotellaceae bacterium]|jgi:23S rRNA pseudouridine1911/1915/1917 synthase|nr:RluA family pseudouridine synthase [Prevotellaceae bacterium]
MKQPHSKKTKQTTFNVGEQAELMPFLIAKMGGSRTAVKSLLSHRQVSINDKVTTRYNTLLEKGDIITINHSRGNVALVHPKLRILYEDSALIIVEKKEGLLTVGTEKGHETTAFDILKNHVKKSSPRHRIYTIHRLDRETSGVLVFAKSREIQLKMQANWHQTVVKRIYIALVEGRVEKESAEIRTWLTENEKSLKVHSSVHKNDGREAVTHYKRIKSNATHSLLEIALETGRKNQIRVHMQSIGHPIAGDKKYGAQTNPLRRIGLHARILAFHHPVTDHIVRYETPVPRPFLHLFH